MAARDRWEVTVKCPKCGRTGTVDVSEDDHPWMRGDTRRIDAVSEGVSADLEGHPGTVVATCTSCNVKMERGVK